MCLKARSHRQLVAATSRNNRQLVAIVFDSYVIVRPQSTVEYTNVASVSTVDSGLVYLIHDRCSSDVERLCLTSLQRHPYVRTLVCSRLARCVHSSVNKPGANGRVGYESLTHWRLFREKIERVQSLSTCCFDKLLV